MARFTETGRTVPARFPRIGTIVEGAVISITDSPVPEFENGKVVGPKRDVSGNIIEQTDLVLDVEGVQTLVHTRGGISYAIATALREAKKADLNVGDFLSIEYTEDEAMGDDLDPAKVYTAKIVAGATRSK